MLVPINITGGDYQHKSRTLTKQVTRNFWPQQQASKKARSPYVLQSFYGLKLFASHMGSIDRGMLENQGNLYKVTDTTLYQVTPTGTHNMLGVVPGSSRCILSALNSTVVIANGSGNIYIWDGTTFSQNESPNLFTPRSVAVVNSQAIYDQGSGQGFSVSDVGIPDSISGLNNAAKETYSDALVRPYAFRESLFLMGAETIEPWWDSGQGNPPFDKIQGAVIKMGLGAVNSVAENPDFVFFLGSDKQFHTLTAGSSAVDTVISTPAMAKQIQDYIITDDCIGWAMELEGMWFYVATFPSQNVTWCFPVGGEWFEWGSSAAGRIRGNSYANVFGKKLVAEYNSGDIYELDAETYTDADQPIIRTRDTALIHSGVFGQDNKEFEINSLQFVLETGVGLLSGQGSNPSLMFSVSRDGGKSFGTQRFIKVGRLGQRVLVEAKNLGRFRPEGCVIRLSVSDPIYWCVYSANIDVEICV